MPERTNKHTKKKFTALLSIALLLCIITFSGFYWFFYIQKEETNNGGFTEKSRTYEYTVVIKTNLTCVFYVLCPIPVNSTGSSRNIIENFTVIEGNASLQKNVTIYGEALRITGREITKVKWVETMILLKSMENDLRDLSMTSFTPPYSYEGKSWIYSNCENLSLTIFYNYSATSKYKGITYGTWWEYYLNAHLTVGWQQVLIKCMRSTT